MQQFHTEIWNSDDSLKALNEIKNTGIEKDIAVIIVNRDRPDLADTLVENLKNMSDGLTKDFYVVEMGSTECSKYASINYEDPEYRGKCYGHNVGVRLAKSKGNYKYYLIAMNDIILHGEKPLKEMYDLLEANSEIGLMSPIEPEGHYPDSKRRAVDYHIVSTCDYLCFLMKAECLSEVGFLNPSFKYCWGAIHELSHKMYKAGWKIAYCDKVTMKHLGGTTYGKVKNVISRDKYQVFARQFAARYFVESYGKNWDDLFASFLPKEIVFNTYKAHRGNWENALDKDERESYKPIQGSLDNLENMVRLLDPWYYPVEISGIKVKPGVGSRQEGTLEERTAYRHSMLVDKISKLYDFKNKSVLDIASNCAYWSARYAELGATKVTAVEGRFSYVKQGELYWKHNNFGKYVNLNFIHGNVMDGSLWQFFKEQRFDFVLCCGILYHIKDYTTLLTNCCKAAREAVLVDTRVGSVEEDVLTEPGGWCFDAIVEERDKRVPSLLSVKSILDKEGFNAQVVKSALPLPNSMKSSENYDAGRRICLFATRR